MVDDVLAHHDGARVRQDLVDGRQRRAGEGRQRPPVHVEARDLFGQRLRDDEARRIGSLQDIGQSVEPPGCHQEGPHRVAGLGSAAYDLLALGEEQAVLGLQRLAQLHVPQVTVVGETRVPRVVDLDVRRHAQLVPAAVPVAVPPDGP